MAPDGRASVSLCLVFAPPTCAPGKLDCKLLYASLLCLERRCFWRFGETGHMRCAFVRFSRLPRMDHRWVHLAYRAVLTCLLLTMLGRASMALFWTTLRLGIHYVALRIAKTLPRPWTPASDPSLVMGHLYCRRCAHRLTHTS